MTSPDTVSSYDAGHHGRPTTLPEGKTRAGRGSAARTRIPSRIRTSFKSTRHRISLTRNDLMFHISSPQSRCYQSSPPVCAIILIHTIHYSFSRQPPPDLCPSRFTSGVRPLTFISSLLTQPGCAIPHPADHPFFLDRSRALFAPPSHHSRAETLWSRVRIGAGCATAPSDSSEWLRTHARPRLAVSRPAFSQDRPRTTP